LPAGAIEKQPAGVLADFQLDKLALFHTVKPMKNPTLLIGTSIKLVFKAASIVLIVAFLVPLAYFVWRASQPMEMPQFGGLTYYQLLNKRRQAYTDLAREYQAGHPDQEVNFGACFPPEVAIQVIGAIPTAGFYALAGIYPQLQRYVNPGDLRQGFVSKNVNWSGFPLAWWTAFEKLVWGMITHSPHGPVPYCRISPP
jgi:hypothetical protein